MCELVIKTAIKNGDYKKMNDTEILEKVKDWLKLNLESDCFNLDIEEDNKALLDAIEDWKSQKKGSK